MKYKNICLWVCVLCVVQNICMGNSVLGVLLKEQHDGTEPNTSISYDTQPNDDNSTTVHNGTNFMTSMMSGDRTSTETNVHDLSEILSSETMSKPSVSVSPSSSVPVSSSKYLSTSDASEETTEMLDECSDNCSSPGFCIFTKPNGCIGLREGCTEYSLSCRIQAPDQSSLIYVEIGEEDEDIGLNNNINMQFEECGVILDTWTLKSGQKISKRWYLSTGAILILRISTDGIWDNFNVYYKELKFESEVSNVDESLDAGVLVPPTFKELSYRPNTVRTYILTASKAKWNESSVMMTLSFVDLDELAGDYLLIGAGKVPFAGPHPLFFTGQMSKSRDYYIASDDVYVFYVFGASQKTEKKGFQIKWERSGTVITKPEDKPDEDTITDSVIQSVGICFYNKSFVAEFNRTDGNDGLLRSFREKLASVANGYAKEKNIFLESILTEFSVEILWVSAIMEPIDDVMPEGAIYAMVTIVHHFDRKTAVFRRNQLEEIISLLEDKDEKTGFSILGFKVGHCPSVRNHLEWYITAALLVLLSSMVLLIVWVYSSVTKCRGIFRREKRYSHYGVDVNSKQFNLPARENEYIRFNPRPRIEITTSDGESVTLNSDNTERCSLDHDDATEKVLFRQDWIMKNRPNRKELPKTVRPVEETEPKRSYLQTFAAPVPSSNRNRSRGSSLLWTADIHMNRLLLPESTQQADHEYDCLVFPNKASTDRDESETKL